MQATARMASVVSSTPPARRRLIRDVRRCYALSCQATLMFMSSLQNAARPFSRGSWTGLLPSVSSPPTSLLSATPMGGSYPSPHAMQRRSFARLPLTPAPPSIGATFLRHPPTLWRSFWPTAISCLASARPRAERSPHSQVSSDFAARPRAGTSHSRSHRLTVPPSSVLSAMTATPNPKDSFHREAHGSY